MKMPFSYEKRLTSKLAEGSTGINSYSYPRGGEGAERSNIPDRSGLPNAALVGCHIDSFEEEVETDLRYDINYIGLSKFFQRNPR